MGSKKGTKCAGALTKSVLDYVAANPGCTSSQVRHDLNSHAASTILSTLHAKGLVDRVEKPAPTGNVWRHVWHYYPKTT